MPHLRHPGVESTRPLVFAHRGGAALAPENTLLAFDRALELGVDGIELDVRGSRDGIVVVHHDATLGRTTGVAGGVETFTAAELGRMDAAYRFQPERGHPFRGQEIGVPRLRDVLARYPGVPLIVELKRPGAGFARAVVDEVRAAGAIDRVCIGAEDVGGLRAVRAHEPRLATSAGRDEVRWWLYRSRMRWPVRHVRYRAFQVPERAGWTRVVSPRFVRHAHAVGVPVQLWTVDEVEDMRRLLDWGVDAIITDRPDVAVPAVRDWARTREGT